MAVNASIALEKPLLVKGEPGTGKTELARQIANSLNLKINYTKDGEQGIYFVKSTSRNLLNPLLGWSQGHFLIHEVLGERRMRTIDQKPVIQIQAVSSIPPSIKKPQALIEGNGDVAAGVNVDPDELTTERALTVDEFKDSILELIEN